MTASTKPGPHRATALRRRVIDPALSETSLTSLSDLNRLVRTRMLGGVGAGEGDLPGYPIRSATSSWLSRVPSFEPATQPVSFRGGPFLS
jgi:hypothetical protein